MTHPTVVVLHDNASWLPPFERAFAAQGAPWRALHVDDAVVDLDAPPPPGEVLWSRLSASAHTRGVRGAYEKADAVLGWYERAGRRVVNGTAAAALEVSKIRQHAVLAAAGFDVPRTVAAGTVDALVAAGASIGYPLITKHNRGGKGLGVRRVESAAELAAVAPDVLADAVDGIALVQELLVAPEPTITRHEFVGGRLHYAVRVDTSGGFELCPAEACAVPGTTPARPLFEVRDDVRADDPFVVRLGELLVAAGVEVAGVEVIETLDGRAVPYDVNTNTNYNPDVEAQVPVPAAVAVVRWLTARADASHASRPAA